MTASTLPLAGQRVGFYCASGSIGLMREGEIAEVADSGLRVTFAQSLKSLEPAELVNREIVMYWTTGGTQSECPMIIEGIDGNTLLLRAREKESREFLRIHACLQVFYETVAEEDREEVEDRIMGDVAPVPPEQDSETERFWHKNEPIEQLREEISMLSAAIDRVDAKLDFLIAHAEGANLDTRTRLVVTLLDISGAGLAFLSPASLARDTLLALTIQFCRFPVDEVQVLAKVVRCVPTEKEEGFCEIGVQFLRMQQAHRERIFRFISRAERRMLRERKELLTR